MVKVFEIVLNDPPSPRGFVSGSELTGKAVVKIDEGKSYRLIEVGLTGSGKVKWTEGHGEESETHRATEDYVNQNLTLWGADLEADTLAAGRHEFPFAFSIPESCPPSWGGGAGVFQYSRRLDSLRPDRTDIHQRRAEGRSYGRTAGQNLEGGSPYIHRYRTSETRGWGLRMLPLLRIRTNSLSSRAASLWFHGRRENTTRRRGGERELT